MWERGRKVLPVIALAVAGLGVSIAIEVVHRRLGADASYTSFCNINARVNCDVVLTSRYAWLAGFSVATWAILFYGAMLALAVGVAVSRGAQRRARLAQLGAGLAGWGVLYSAYLAVIAFFVLHTVCVMCSTLYLINISLFATAWWLRAGTRVVRGRAAAPRRAQDRAIFAASVVAVLALVGVGSWEALGGGVHELDAASIARERPQFYRWYMEQPLAPGPLDDGHTRGSSAAPVTIVEFSDFECSHCAEFHRSLEAIWPRVAQRVRVVFRHFPLDASCNPGVVGELHPQACLAAVASECAADQGKFWPYHDMLFAHQQDLGRQFLIEYAARLDLDVPRFTACLGSAAARARVERDTAAGDKLGVDSTPTLFINGRIIKGALDAQALADAVVLAQAGAAAR